MIKPMEQIVILAESGSSVWKFFMLTMEFSVSLT